MDSIFQGVFSEYTVKGVAFKPKGESTYTLVDGAGSASEEYERRVVTKAKSNVTVKRIARQAGSGTLTLSLHMPQAMYNKLQGLIAVTGVTGLTGVYALGGRAKIPSCEIAMEVEDEDGATKFKYYPCASSTSFSRSVESEADTVAEVEMTFDLSVDAAENIVYEALKTELPVSGSLNASNWMSAVSTELLTGVTGATGTTA